MPLSSLPAAAISSSYAIQESIALGGTSSGGGGGGTRAAPPSSGSAKVSAQPVTSTDVTGIDFTSMLHLESSVGADEPSENPLLFSSQPHSSGSTLPTGAPATTAAVYSPSLVTSPPAVNAAHVTTQGAESIDADELIARQLQAEENQRAASQAAAARPVAPASSPRIVLPAQTVAAPPPASQTVSQRRDGDAQNGAVYMKDQECADREHALWLQAQYDQYDRQNIRNPTPPRRSSASTKSGCVIS